MSVSRVYSAIAAVIGELSTNGVGKRHINARDRYDYRSVDDLYERLSPLLATHRLCILPRILKRTAKERFDEHGGAVTSVTVRAAFDIVSAEDGSCHVIESFGEALDASDKATAKAMTAAYKYALFQAFCIPCAESEDADALSIRLKAHPVVEPNQGWTQWGHQVLEAVAGCETSAAIETVQASNRDVLRSLAMHDVALYGRIGEAIRVRRRRRAPMSRLLPARRDRGPRKSDTERSCPGHRAWVRAHRCCVRRCAEEPIECAHVRRGTDGGISLKPSDRWCVSLCAMHHAEQHLVGELEFERRHGLDLMALAEMFARLSPHRVRL